jgi:hypothetical protein
LHFSFILPDLLCKNERYKVCFKGDFKDNVDICPVAPRYAFQVKAQACGDPVPLMLVQVGSLERKERKKLGPDELFGNDF